MPQGATNTRHLVALVADEETGLPASARASLTVLTATLAQLDEQIETLDAEIGRRARGKQRLGVTTKMGERSLRRLLIIGANSVIIERHCHASARPGTWLAGMLERKPTMLVRVAPANKMARIVWALMKNGEIYRAPAMAV